MVELVQSGNNHRLRILAVLSGALNIGSNLNNISSIFTSNKSSMLEVHLASLIDVESNSSDIFAETERIVFSKMSLELRFGINQKTSSYHQLTSGLLLLLLRHNQIVLLVDISVSTCLGRSHRHSYSLLLREVLG